MFYKNYYYILILVHYWMRQGFKDSKHLFGTAPNIIRKSKHIDINLTIRQERNTILETDELMMNCFHLERGVIIIALCDWIFWLHWKWNISRFSHETMS